MPLSPALWWEVKCHLSQTSTTFRLPDNLNVLSAFLHQYLQHHGCDELP